MRRLACLILSILLCLSGCTSFVQTQTGPSASSQAKPESFVPEGRTIYSNNVVMEYNGLVYLAADNNIYSYDGKTCKAVMSGDHNSPRSFYIDGGRLLYITQGLSTIFMRDLYNPSDENAEKAFGSLYMEKSWFYHATFLAAEGHVFYRGSDRKLHRATTDGKNDRVISDIDAENLTYSNGYLYFMEWEKTSSNLYRIKTDGTEQKKLPKQADDGFFISQQGNLYFVRPDHPGYPGEIYLQVDYNGTVMKNIGKFSIFSAMNIDNSYIYMYQYSGEGDNCSILRVPLGGGDEERIHQNQFLSIEDHEYRPVFVGDYIYFSTDRMLYRIKKDGSELTEIGVECTPIKQ